MGISNTEVTYAKLPIIKVDEALATLTSSRAAVEKLRVNIGRSDLSANGSLTNYWGWFLRNETLTGSLAVSSKRLDLNELMEGLAGEDVAETTDQGSAKRSRPSNLVQIPRL